MLDSRENYHGYLLADQATHTMTDEDERTMTLLSRVSNEYYHVEIGIEYESNRKTWRTE